MAFHKLITTQTLHPLDIVIKEVCTQRMRWDRAGPKEKRWHKNVRKQLFLHSCHSEDQNRTLQDS